MIPLNKSSNKICLQFNLNKILNQNVTNQQKHIHIIEHKHIEGSQSNKTVITREYPKKWVKGDETYYPLNDDKNSKLYEKYQELAKKEDKVIFGGRLGMYKYFDMWQVIDEALKVVKSM